MSHVGKLATALTVVFLISLLTLAAELLYLLFRGRHRRFFCFTTQTIRVEPSAGSPTQDPDGSTSHDDSVIDVFKLLEATGGHSRVLCTIKEEDEIAVSSLQECMEAEAAVVEDAKTVVSCDSPMFFTPVGSPARDGDGVWSEIVSPVKSSCGG